MVRYGCNCCFSFWAILCPFTPSPPPPPPNNPKNENFKKNEKNAWTYHHFTQVYQKSCHTVLEIWCVANVTVIFHFGLLFALLPPSPFNCLKNENFNKTKKNTRAYHHFTQVYQKS